MVTLTINGKLVFVPIETTLLDACRMNGIDISTLCYDEDLKINGSCRMCVVECTGRTQLLAACCTPVENGMIIETESPAVVEARKVILELLLSRHKLECKVCQANGDCRLQDYCYRYGVAESSFTDGGRPVYPIEDLNPFIERDYDKCIMCTRCVRVCEEITVARALGIKGRGHHAQVSTAFDSKLEDSTCVFCGQCIMVCPVGALSSKVSAAYKEKVNDIGQSMFVTDCFQLFYPFQKLTRYFDYKVLTTCSYCGTGCTLELNVKNNKVVGVSSNRDENASPVNKGALCVKGRFEWDFINSADRLTTPLIREDGELRPASWDEALERVAEGFKKVKQEHGPDAYAMFTSPRLSNEENYLAQKFTRVVMGTNNINHWDHLSYSVTVAGMRSAFGSGAMTNSISELEKDVRCIFIIGSNTTENHPVIGMKTKKSVIYNGAQLIVADPRIIELGEIADVYMRQKPGTDVALLNGMMHVIIKEGLAKTDFIQNCTENYDGMAEVASRYTPELTSEITGIPIEDIIKAARLYATSKAATIFYAMENTQHSTRTDEIKSICNLAMLTGNIGRLGTGVNLLSCQNNLVGACDMGGLPMVYTGYQEVTNPDVKVKFEKAWGVRLSDKNGLSLTEAINKAHNGKMKALYVLGESQMTSNLDLHYLEEAFEKLDFLVVQDIFLTETAKYANVVLPSACFAEKDGTFTNTERRVQRVQKAVDPPGEARAGWQIICDLSNRMGYQMDFLSAEDIFEEIRTLTPSYAGINYARLAGKGVQWPCPNLEHPGTPYLHKDGKFNRGQGLFSAIEFKVPIDITDEE